MASRTTSLGLVVGCCWWLAGGDALGQLDSPPPVEPSRAPEARPTEPTSPLAQAALVGGRLLPEGAFVVSQAARLVEAPTGDWVAVYLEESIEGSGRPLAPMVVVPSRTLERVLQTRENDASIVELTGRVLLYRGRNYLVATSFGLRAPVVAEGDGADSGLGEGTGERESGDAGRAESREVRALLEELGAIDEGTKPAIAPVTTTQGDASSSVGEGTTILRRRGRVERDADGGWSLTLDGDGDALVSAARYRLVPGSVLQRIEATAGRLGADFALIITGKTLTFGDDVYLLASSFTIEPVSQVGPIQ